MDTVRSWMKPFARMGYAARGLVYFIIGLFAFLASTGAGEEKGSRDALQKLLEQPFGAAMVWCLVAGLAGYVLWRLIQSLADADGHGTGPKGLAIRAGLLASAFTYATLAVYALSMLGVFAGGGGGSGGGGDAVVSALNGIVGQRFVSLAFGLVMLGVAGAHFWKAARRKYADHFTAGETAMAVIHPVSMIGLAARGFVLAIIALLFFYRFASADRSGDHPGLKEALGFVQSLPAGALLLAATGLGLLAFSAYSFIEARWRRIEIAD